MVSAKGLTHVDGQGQARMVNVGDKPLQKRYAKARGKILLAPATLLLLKRNQLKKGDVLAVARVAGIQAAKSSAHLIPLCHTLLLDQVAVEFHLQDDGVVAFSEVYCTGRTGVEMEALSAVSGALLTIYDMCKAVDKNMRLTDIYLLVKEKEYGQEK